MQASSILPRSMSDMAISSNDRWWQYYSRECFQFLGLASHFYLVAFALAGMAIGAAAGYVGNLAFRTAKANPSSLLKDSLLGGFGYLAALVSCAFMPWPENTVIEKLDGGGTVSTTMNSYQHPHRVAVILAILLPIIHQLYRWRKGKRAFLT